MRRTIIRNHLRINFSGSFSMKGLLLLKKQTQTNYPAEIKTVSRGWVLYALFFSTLVTGINDIAAKLCGISSPQRVNRNLIRSFNNSAHGQGKKKSIFQCMVETP